jgi:hypothetical protein
VAGPSRLYARLRAVRTPVPKPDEYPRIRREGPLEGAREWATRGVIVAQRWLLPDPNIVVLRRDSVEEKSYEPTGHGPRARARCRL